MSAGELIELQDLRADDRIELTLPSTPRTARLERVNAVRLSPGRVPELLSRVRIIRLLGGIAADPQPEEDTQVEIRVADPKLVEEVGEGHDFQPCSHTQPTWCDLCGDFIWGLYKQSLRCVNCRFTCHYRCRALIKLDCSLDEGSVADQTSVTEEDTIESDTNVDEQTEGLGKQELSPAEIQKKVKEYNAQINSNLFMTWNKDGSYTGFIKVHLKLVRPVSVPPPRKGSSAQDPPGRGKPAAGSALKRRTSFYLPKDTAKHLHISSRTSSREVIQALLKKFTVLDNPAKFALFERSERHDQVYLRKLSDDECPLRLRLCAGPNEKVLSLVLKENETGEVNWDAFSSPELANFLRILKREEEEHVKQIILRYNRTRQRLQEALSSSTPG
ncbi:ras association domain-containing protein 1-like isoform X1 [Alosa alosa]|uniref:ras association domain-containing protein 1-like isoform X1 n=1 Tax=Alosa sapidissima TaxID=34773 RepID=UPI001C0A4803|nr:ras association domain-containing protein 1-like isoform X1 [Alosa sapidissima]XP_048111372.1 ras association domain-containing protein 1-like isoform X1 [Alosa alosa]